MKQRAQPLFLARRSYRHRRIVDASRIIPIMGLLLFMMPLLWSIDASPGSLAPGLAGQAIYLFAVWFVLVAAAGIVARLMPGGEPEATPRDGDGTRS